MNWATLEFPQGGNSSPGPPLDLKFPWVEISSHVFDSDGENKELGWEKSYTFVFSNLQVKYNISLLMNVGKKPQLYLPVTLP